MSNQPCSRRRFLRKPKCALTTLAVVLVGLGLPVHLLSVRAAAEELAPGTAYRATAYYERTGLGREMLVAMVLVPLNGASPLSIQNGTGLDKRELGEGPLETFQGRVGGMERKLLLDHGALLAVVYSARTPEGAYAEQKQYLLGRSELDVENPRARAERTLGRGGNSGEGGGGGGSSM
ncbi:MAG TPA: hypothetical protein VLT62_01975 [Candidatus Methylomirabilis sp.]|nr:hypothetical protein [Candidatus Methylomirabilis sp.]